jgi:opacity protein-like surface antigen
VIESPRAMSKRIVPAAAVLALLAFAGRAWPQLVIGQYEDEAPLRSWNAPGTLLAPSLACGGAGIAAGWDASSALVNPALACSLPRFTASVSASYLSASLMRYSILNTGVLSTPGPVTDRSLGVDFGGLAFRLGKWAFAASADLSENYGRPLLEYRAEERGIQVYSIRAEQAGWLRSFNLTAARTISRRLSAGLGFRILRGEIERTTAETFAADGVLIDDGRRQTLSGTSWSAGLTYAFSGRVSGGLVFQAPLVLRASSRSLLEYRAPEFGTDIAISADERDRYERPWAAGAGVSWRPAERLRVVSDVRFVKWSSYKASYFGEPKTRDFRDVWTAAAGIEYSGFYRLFGRNVICPFRIGIALDPQPMKAPGSTYTYLTFGSGLAMGRVRLDISAALGGERGSGDGLTARRAVMTLSYDLGSDRP